ncbi:MAG: phosphatase PAP2 family protein [Aeromicrobium erythreum]
MSVLTPVPRTVASVRPRALAAVVAGVSLTALVAVVALSTRAGQDLDGRAFYAVVVSRDSLVTVLSVLGRVSIAAVLAVVVVCTLVALARRSVLLAVAAVGLVVGANVTTQVLKRVVLDRTTFDWDLPNSLPSGHTTAVVAGVGALGLVAPVVLRPLLAPVGAFVVTLVGSSTVVAGWHRPSDVLAALAVTLAWTGVAALVAGGPRDASGTRATVTVAGALLGAFAATVVLVMIGARPTAGWDGVVPAVLVHGTLAVATALAVSAMCLVSPVRPVDAPAQP